MLLFKFYFFIQNKLIIHVLFFNPFASFYNSASSSVRCKVSKYGCLGVMFLQISTHRPFSKWRFQWIVGRSSGRRCCCQWHSAVAKNGAHQNSVLQSFVIPIGKRVYWRMKVEWKTAFHRWSLSWRCFSSPRRPLMADPELCWHVCF